MKPTNLTFIYATLLQILCCVACAHAQTAPYARIEFDATQTQLRELARAGIDTEHLGREIDSSFSSDFSQEEQALLQKICPKRRVRYADVSAHYVAQNKRNTAPSATAAKSLLLPTGFRLGSMGGYLTCSEYSALMDSLHTIYPTLVSAKQSIGTTIEGREIYTFKISDNVTIDEPEPEVLYTALIHAREPLSAMQLWFFTCDLLQRYVQNDPEARFLINNRELYILPVWNPDGYEYNEQTNPQGGGMWRKNRRDNGDGTLGVDLNRNFATGFAYDDTGSSPDGNTNIYRGAFAFSEPETAAFQTWCNARQFKTAFIHHSYSNVLIRPIGYDETLVCDDEDAYTEYTALLTQENGYLSGRTSEVLGYNVNGVTDDWLYLERTTKPKIIAFTPETGSTTVGFWPPQDSILPYCRLMQPANQKLAWLAGEYFLGTTNAPTDIYSPTVRVPFTLRNIGQTTSLPYSVTIQSNNFYFTGSDTKNYQTLGSFQLQNDTLQFTCNQNIPDNAVILANLAVTIDGYTQKFPFLMRYHYVATENERLDATISLSPNPTHDFITIKHPIASADKDTQLTQLIIRNSLGQLVLEKNVSNKTETTLDLSFLPSSVYFLACLTKNNVLLTTKKIVRY